MNDAQIEARRIQQDAYWDGPRLHMLLAVTLAASIAVIYFIASVRSGDFSWDPTAHDPATQIMPSGW